MERPHDTGKTGGIWTHLNAASAVTLLGLVLGLCAMLAAHERQFDLSVILLAFCVVCDRLDGAIARKLNQTSQFGAELDNLSDAVSFGVAPAAVLYLASSQWWVAIPAIVLALGAVLRLARYSLVGLMERDGKKYFMGVPVPYTAAVLLLVWPLARELGGTALALLLTAYALALAVLMVSRLPIRKGAPVERILLLTLYPALLIYLVVRAFGV